MGTEDTGFINLNLICIECGAGGSFNEAPGKDVVFCASCGREYSVAGGIINFTHELAHTELDNIDYDSVYFSDIEDSIGYFTRMAKKVEPVLDLQYKNVLEVGCGTGHISIGLFGRINADLIVFSDISTKMLAACKGKIGKYYKEKPAGKTARYVAMDGNHFNFAGRSFDLVLGHGVLHHILNYESFLNCVHDVLTDEGVALFLEPAQKFYRVLNFILEGLFEKLRYGDIGLADDDFNKLLAFYHFNHGEAKYSGVPEFVASQEDKHQFVREDLTAKLNTAGFSSVKVIPAYPANFYSEKMRTHCNELKISDAGKTAILGHIMGYEDTLLPLLDRESLSCADFYLFEKKPRVLPAVKYPVMLVSNTGRRETHAETHLKVAIDNIPKCDGAADSGVEITGWAIASKEIHRLIAYMGDEEYSGYLTGCRMDVFEHYKHNPAYRARDLICSGFKIICPGLVGPSAGLKYKIEFADGTEIPVPGLTASRPA